ncbi:putative heme-dependent peroxidase [Alicyclobacillus cellulosilyticus]|uniref:Coproheme decarboxylase n=1 Tax=Alicyclobacillus cellulosilyticus TaxID=1003997 RepID=A0A917KFE1_9BACL|nr:hydrogen peroxide-dependent heme synthase [Alicyclobacillus cellulosilyticus]GGJ10167.1 putative heme-dependent peroxidase [Alicyclobacillus cellulosilyticus]
MHQEPVRHEAVETLEGWYVWHDFRRIDWVRWKEAPVATRTAATAALISFHRENLEHRARRQGSYAAFAVAGSEADLLFLHLRPTIQELNDLKFQLAKTPFADYTFPVYSYISVVELSAYLAKPGVDPMADPYVVSRLQPALPDMQYVCFYPMSKRRQGSDNWYMLPMEERRRLMKSHGQIGRQYAGKVVQMISGSVGLDDWEWGVTLFADDPLHFKKLVYEMRFDEASARYADFGPFYVGVRQSEHDLRRLLACT